MRKRRHSSSRPTPKLKRSGLAAQEPAALPVPVDEEPHAGGVRTGMDAVKLNQLVDQVEAKGFGAEARRKP